MDKTPSLVPVKLVLLVTTVKCTWTPVPHLLAVYMATVWYAMCVLYLNHVIYYIRGGRTGLTFWQLGH